MTSPIAKARSALLALAKNQGGQKDVWGGAGSMNSSRGVGTVTPEDDAPSERARGLAYKPRKRKKKKKRVVD